MDSGFRRNDEQNRRPAANMPNPHYAFPPGGLPPQTQRTVDRATFTTAYALIPRGVMRDIVTSNLPHWNKTRAWILTRPMSGFAETFAQYAVEVEPGGGSDRPEPDARAEGVLFVAGGEPTLTLDGKQHALRAGSYAFIPPGVKWSLHNRAATQWHLHFSQLFFAAVAPFLVDYDRVFLPLRHQ